MSKMLGVIKSFRFIFLICVHGGPQISPTKALHLHAYCCGVVIIRVSKWLRSVSSLLKPHPGADCRPAAGTRRAAAESRVEKRPPAFQAQPGLGILSTFLLRKTLALFSHNFLMIKAFMGFFAARLRTNCGVGCDAFNWQCQDPVLPCPEFSVLPFRKRLSPKQVGTQESSTW